MDSAKESAERREGEPAVGDIVANKYKLERELGRGGMGKVFAAENLRTGKRVALKYILAPEGSSGLTERFAREARAAGRIHHPAVIEIYDVVEDDLGTALVMEYLEGESLRGLLDRVEILPVVDAVSILVLAARGVAAAHAQGVIHRDLKPDNLFLCVGPSKSRLRVLDFGVSKLVADEANPSITKTGAVVGTPHYMAPEQVRGVSNLDHRIDVYALGAVLFEMLTGQPPFDHAKVTGLLVKIATEDAPRADSLRADLPVELVSVITRALAKNPDERYQDAASLAHAIERFGDGVSFDDEDGQWTKRISGDGPSPATEDASFSAPTVDARVVSTLAASGERPRGSTVEDAPRRGPWIGIGLAIVGALLAVGLGYVWITQQEEATPSEVDRVDDETPPEPAEVTETEPVQAVEVSPPEEPPVELRDETIEIGSVLEAPEPTRADGARRARDRTAARAPRVPSEEPAPEPSRTPRAGTITLEDF